MPRETVLSLLQKSALFLEEKGVSEARASAEILLCHTLLCKRIDLYLRFDQPVKEEELALFRDAIRRRLKGEPVQYIVGRTEFYGLPFKVDPSVLIPRPETEHVVEACIAACRQLATIRDRLFALDIGTGSGAIAIALAKHIPNLECLAIDVSAEALQSALRNADANGVASSIEFRQWDVLGPGPIPSSNRFHLIVSNPPYIAEAEVAGLQIEVRDFEPRIATSDGADGLTFYHRIAAIAPGMLEPDGFVVLELGDDVSGAVREIFASVFSHLTIEKDYAGTNRVLVARQPQ